MNLFLFIWLLVREVFFFLVFRDFPVVTRKKKEIKTKKKNVHEIQLHVDCDNADKPVRMLHGDTVG